MTEFDDWRMDQSLMDDHTAYAAEAAWNHQQAQIDELSALLEPSYCDGPESEGFTAGFEERSGQHLPGAKNDKDKMDLTLLDCIPNALYEVCRVMDFGQKKYSRGGFLLVPDAVRRYTAAMLRHWFKESVEKYDSGDPFYDTSIGLSFKGKIRHDAQVAVNAIFRLECTLQEEQNEEQRKVDAITDLYKDKSDSGER